MTAPQSVTERYVSNLIMHGSNKEFSIDIVTRRSIGVEGDHIGFYYTVKTIDNTNKEIDASGPTIACAVRAALIKHGVTFR